MPGPSSVRIAGANRRAQRLYNQRLTLQLKFSAAANLSVDTDREKMFFLRTYAEMQYKENRLRLAERKLALHCQEALNRKELANAAYEAESQAAAARAMNSPLTQLK